MSQAEAVVFKGSRRGVELVLQARADFATAMEELRRKLEQSGGFFAGAAVTVTVDRPLAPAEAAELVGVLCADHGLQLAGIVNPAAFPAARPAPAAPAAAARRSSRQAKPAEQPPEEQERTLLVRRTIRSGQRVAFDGNVVVLGDLNPGGEVVASGDILVWGALRGTAHAGAAGRTSATVTALRLIPTQLRIAHLITRSPDGQPAATKGPEIARIKGEAVVVEELTV